MKKQLFMLVMLTVGFAACKKENEKFNDATEGGQSNTITARSAMVIPGPENRLNPYDSIGYWHNEIVAYIQSCRSETGMPDVVTSTQCVMQFYSERQGIDLPASYFETVGQTVDRSNNSIEELITTCPYEEPVKEALNVLVRLLKRLSDNDSDYPEIKVAITDFEHDILQSDRLTDEGRAIVLKTTAVARYSIYYWIGISTPPVSGSAFKFKNIVKWIAAVTSDIGGAIVSGNAGYAADCSSYAYDLVTYGMP